MPVLAGRDQAAEEREPQHELLQVVGPGGHEEAERAAEGVGQGQERGDEEGQDQEAVLQVAHDPADRGRRRRGERALDRARLRLGRHFPAAAPRCFRYSSR